jgi:hypothetical protein
MEIWNIHCAPDFVKPETSLPGPDPLGLARGTGPDMDPGPSIIRKNSKKNLDSYCFVTSL